ncbi:serine/threonine-protein phosphatase with EF-hands 2 [Camelus ferus]|uniref:Serine/threonine-protein phosphatase with EF-hands n=3 Tax=Camelus TaxID=9836 RepID=A0A8B8R6V9_CAMFR|nr:serine/threonine-protein phosphatase with EF-hands 2 [Camelus ferus]XP_010967618.1 serine/threonine-protein phosphatase with EF-hands 2 [Camelus bactrianus]XP_010981320.2 serine/threonine-protein phosphatase with EF-hands 2 [Camelus dromedarius]XP_031326729.1 serine/threonine-protein phosphatase with EF-hands 2 [Camelus dromedarius]XP_032313721.1 serine/threonine-protein phosphatase with EF-hands 2 [Camelus ferus]
MGSGSSTQHHFAFQNAEKAFKAAALIQRWYRRYMARLEMRRHCTWSIFQSIEYAGQQDQVKLHNFFSYLVDHFTPSSHNERDFLNRMFTEERSPQDSEMEKSSDYESIEVPDSYTGPRLSFPLLPDHATALVEAFRLKQRLHARYVLNLLHEARRHLVQLPNISRLSTCYSEEITVCGDLHGQLDDLIFIFYKNGLPSPERAYVFNGDFVDRGKDSIEILMILFAFMLVYPKEFHLNRGNHEDHMVNLRYGFTKEVMQKYKIHGKKILKILQDVFCLLPLATLVDEKVLILHGGVSDTTDLELLAKLDRHKIVSTLRCKTRKENKKPAEEKGKNNQMSSAGRPSPWFLPQSRSLPSSPLHPSAHKAARAGRSSSVPCSVAPDPKELSRQVRRSVDLELERCRQQAGFPAIEEKEEPVPSASEAEEQLEPTQEEWRQVVDILWSDPMAQEGCKANTVRGGGCYFGPNVTERLLQKYSLQFLIRSHECKPEGYEFCHNRKVLTIFSASNYYEVGSNRGAYVKLGPALTPHIVQFQANKATHKLTMRQRISRVEASALRALREKLFAHSSDLLIEFKKHDKDKTGLVTLSDWAAAVESVLHLGLPWRMLRPQLVNSQTDNMLEYKSWLENLAKEKLSHENIQSSLLETLYRNRSNLETIFRIIDSDHSGFISLDEFRQTWKLFSSHMNIDITDDCICDLARSIDFNKDGHIDINEFLEAFRLVEQSCSEGDASDCPRTTNTNSSACSSPGAH